MGRGPRQEEGDEQYRCKQHKEVHPPENRMEGRGGSGIDAEVQGKEAEMIPQGKVQREGAKQQRKGGQEEDRIDESTLQERKRDRESP